MKLLRTIRLDPSDTFIFPQAAEPGEWAISGAFLFADAAPARLEGKLLSAFRGGFLGVPSLGWSTLAQIVTADEDDRAAAIDSVARCLLERCGAPDRAAALLAAREEIDFAASLCTHEPDTLIAVHRTDENGAIRESFRSLHPRRGLKDMPVFSFLELDEEEAPGESVELTRLARGDGG